MYLRQALESIHLQLSTTTAISPLIEVVVADNASTDDTPDVLNQYANLIENFISVRNPQNVGFDGNVNVAVRAARGQYCWYLGDDDIILPGAIEHMLEICKTNAPAVISVLDEPLTDRQALPNIPQSYDVSNHISELSPTASYVRGHLPSALSMLAFKRDAWLAAADFDNHIPGWFYFETILRIAAKDGNSVLHVPTPMIATGQDMRWADGGAGLKIFIDCNRFLRKMINWGYDRKTITAELTENMRRFPRVLLQAKVRGLPITVDNRERMRSYTKDAPIVVRMLSELLFAIPNAFIRVLWHAKKKLL